MKIKLILSFVVLAVPLFAATVTYKTNTGEITGGVPTGQRLDAGPGEGTLSISDGEYRALVDPNAWPPPWKIFAGAMIAATAGEQENWRPKEQWELITTFISNKTEQATTALAVRPRRADFFGTNLVVISTANGLVTVNYGANQILGFSAITNSPSVQFQWAADSGTALTLRMLRSNGVVCATCTNQVRLTGIAP